MLPLGYLVQGCVGVRVSRVRVRVRVGVRVKVRARVRVRGMVSKVRVKVRDRVRVQLPLSLGRISDLRKQVWLPLWVRDLPHAHPLHPGVSEQYPQQSTRTHYAYTYTYI